MTDATHDVPRRRGPVKATPTRDLRAADGGGQVTVRFYVAPLWQQYGPTETIQRRQPFVHSLPALNGGLSLFGRVFWDGEEVFRTKPLWLKEGDTFTFNFGEAGS